MSTFFRMALTATLALSASLSLVGSESVHAEVSEVADAFSAPQIASLSNTANRSEIAIESSSSNTFDPEPNPPPKSTGGSGTR